MSSFAFRSCRVALAATAGCAMFAFGVPSAPADPSTDALGFVDSSARCASPDTAVAVGSTATSRVAICESSSGKYEYRGVRISDGAKLVVPATASGDGGYVGESDGITYTVTSSSLVVSQGSQVIRSEPMVYFHGAKTTPTQAAAPTPTTSTVPLPPPLPAEVGGGKH
jgi:hypothetical protein